MSGSLVTYTGGALDTNAFLLEASGGNILFDAPQGADAFFSDHRVDLLVLTHGHFDHVADAAALHQRHGCPVATHRDTLPMITDREFFRKWGFGFEVEPVEPQILLEPGNQSLLGEPTDIFLIPGHCPGSLCFFLSERGILIGGDVLFAGGIGRWDLPGGNYPELINGIRQFLLPLPDSTVVYPGHGPTTGLGHEKHTNPFLA